MCKHLFDAGTFDATQLQRPRHHPLHPAAPRNLESLPQPAQRFQNSINCRAMASACRSSVLSWPAAPTRSCAARLSYASQPPQVAAARNAVKRLRTLRHPSILRFVDTHEVRFPHAPRRVRRGRRPRTCTWPQSTWCRSTHTSSMRSGRMLWRRGVSIRWPFVASARVARLMCDRACWASWPAAGSSTATSACRPSLLTTRRSGSW